MVMSKTEERALNAMGPNVDLGTMLKEAGAGGPPMPGTVGVGGSTVGRFVTLEAATNTWLPLPFGTSAELKTGVMVKGGPDAADACEVALSGAVEMVCETDIVKGDQIKAGGIGRAQPASFMADQVIDAALSIVDATGITDPSNASAFYIVSDNAADTAIVALLARTASADSSEFLTLNGTTGVTTAAALSTVLNGVHALGTLVGTVTVQEDDENGAVLATLTPAAPSLGVSVPARKAGFIDVIQVNRADAGTQKLTVFGYDAANALQSEQVTLNGATDVNVTQAFAHVLGWATAAMTDGDALDITLDAAEATSVVLGIAVTGGRRDGKCTVQLFV